MIDLEAIRELLQDYRTHIAVAQITQLELAADRSVLRAKCLILPEQREVIASLTWEHVGPDAGIFAFPSVNDLVLVAFAEGSAEHAFVIRRLTSQEDRIPVQAADGAWVFRALAGRKLHILSDTNIYLGRGGDVPTENLVLGQELKTLLSQVLQLIADHQHTGNLGFPTGPPLTAASFTAKKADPVDNGKILSDLSFTEK